ncbi:hypothetical protein [Dyella acidiphila]|uniref:Uncharacterized protein n=1 Tax=Dyella acidiphila TaxID=2775866 RepID=A0ABR9G9N1_9GAMM|nr:hypothetical protein [Dyella acidiphila]MBE1160733.1 hypothetical protein [Dyella acidiphila]
MHFELQWCSGCISSCIRDALLEVDEGLQAGFAKPDVGVGSNLQHRLTVIPAKAGIQ